MGSDHERREEHMRARRIDAAFLAGDLDALREAVGDPSVIPNGPMPATIGSCLEYAIYHSPLPFIRTLLEIGADPNPTDHAGFPPLIAALTCSLSHPGAPARDDVLHIIRLLLDFGADPDQRGFNDYTPLHSAVEHDNIAALRLLLERGADPNARTRIDDLETARELAVSRGRTDMAALLEAAETARS